MTRFSSWRRRLGILLRREAVEREMDAEMRHHVECEIADRIGRGMAPDEARRTALRDFGGIERFKEEGRDARGTRALEDVVLDVRHGLRSLRRAPGLSVASVLTVALGVSASTAIFAMTYGVLLRPLPYRDPDRLVVLWEHDLRHGHDRNVVSLANFEAWRDRSRAFLGMAALVPASVTIAQGREPERVPGAEVSPGYFALLGVAPALGRGLSGAQGEVVLSDAFWKRRFGGDASVLGRAITLRGGAYTVVGVMPPGFDPPRLGWLGEQELWLPFRATAESRAWGRFLLVVARLQPGVSLDSARAGMAELGRQLARESPSDAGWSVSVVGLSDEITADARDSLLALLGAVGLLLLVAATNASLLTLAFLDRCTADRALRLALGASPRRIVQQVVTQSALVGLLGAGAGIAAAFGAVRLLLPLLPADLPRAASIRVDGPVLLFCVGAAAAATLAAGAVAALRSLRATPFAVLGEGAAGRVARGPGSGLIVAAEVGLAVVISVLAGLTLRSYAALRAVDLGFDADGVVAARLSLSPDYGTPERARAFFDALLERVRGTAGVRSAGLVSTRPFGGLDTATGVGNPTREDAKAPDRVVADVRFADAGFFHTLRIPLVAGQPFTDREPSSGRPAVLVNETMAALLWPGESPVGRSVRIDLFGGTVGEVRGVVRDVHLLDARTPSRATAYLPLARYPSSSLDVVLAGDGSEASLVGSLRSAVAALEPGLPLYRVTSLEGLVETSLARDRLTTLLLSAFSVAALVLASLGIVGVFLGDVARRRQEIGIRRALGAGGSAIVLLVLRRALALAGAGVVAGLAAAAGVSRLMGSLLFGVEATDPACFLTVTGILLGVSAAAALIPGVWASRISPLVAMRGE
jgi:putative ABC transport system permease protein